MAASVPMRAQTLCAVVSAQSNRCANYPVQVHSPNGEFLGTVGEVSVQSGHLRLHTIKYDARLPKYDDWELYGDDQTGVMLYHTPCKWSQLFIDGGVVQVLGLIRDHDCSIMERKF